MNSDAHKEIIVACSSGEVSCAISIIRISGTNFLRFLKPFFDFDIQKITPRFAKFAKIYEANVVIDEIVITFFKGPHSYNGEDILELSVHGNPINVKRILSLLCSVDNFRLAKPGEFSLRALENKKLTLNQVEGLDLLLNANSIFALDQGFSLLSGKLKEDFHQLYQDYLNHKSAIELGFDFLDDVGEEQYQYNLKDTYSKLDNSITNLYRRISNQGFNLIKPDIALVGQPNSGKSTLFNYLLGDERAIVSDIAGTTRDYISEDIFIKNNIFKLIDTAGIRKSSDVIEEHGIKKALHIIKNSFFKILLIDPRNYSLDFFKELQHIQFDLIIFTHRDASHFNDYLKNNFIELSQTIGPIEPTDFGPIEPADFGPIEPADFGPIEPVDFGPIEPGIKYLLAANLNCNSNYLRDYIYKCINLKYLKLLDFDPILIERHRETIKDVYSGFLNYKAVFDDTDDLSVISSELNIVGHCISELIGIVSPDDVLHNIFNNFCIGK